MDIYDSVISNSLLFKEIDTCDIPNMLQCLSSVRKMYRKGEYVYRAGDQGVPLAMLLEGEIHINNEDYWGNQTILAEIRPGDIFAETYALAPNIPLTVNAYAITDCSILLMNASNLLRACPNSCAFHQTLIQNLTEILAAKNLMLTGKLEHMAQRTTRNKLLSYLSLQSLRSGQSTFVIPFNRQQLADYLAVDRSAMSSELSKLRKEGLLDFDKNRFTLH
ncbi:MAG TPA: Crp/Fnr family transcriptional regulator [Anaerovoracaceae bacterium]|nr:Crp/Fnr family transcriptional regulator [Bacillota bacterium]HRV34183.1 Crp/Fnr family transcriptional regulator [Anaerovoracaceae bacterium]